MPHEEVLDLREKLHQLEQEAPRGKGKKHRAEPPPEAKAPPPERPRAADQRDQRKKIAALLESVNGSYQQEKYAAALAGIAEILQLDGENEEALRLKEEILRAQQLAEQIAKEDEKRRKEEAAARSAIKKSEVRSGKIPSERRSGDPVPDKDFWGSSVNSPDSLGIDIMPEEKGPAAPPKPPIMDRVAGKIVRIKIPVKPLLIGLAVVAAVVAIYLVVENIRNAVAPPLYSVLVLPPSVSPADSSLRGVAEGLAVDLAQDLYAVSDLRVVGMSTAYALDASSMGSVQRCRVVASNFFLRWSLSQQGEALLLQAELGDTASSKPIWSSRKVSSLRELARLKTELAQALVAAMNITVSDDEQQALKAIPTSNEYAYAAYLRARSMLRHPDANPIGDRHSSARGVRHRGFRLRAGSVCARMGACPGVRRRRPCVLPPCGSPCPSPACPLPRAA